MHLLPKIASLSKISSCYKTPWRTPRIVPICLTSFLLNFTLCGHSRTCAPLTSLLSVVEAPQPLVCAIRAWSRPAGHQATRTPPARASARPAPSGTLGLPRGPAPVLARRRRDASTAQDAADNGALRRRAGRAGRAGHGCLTSSSPCSYRGAATRLAWSKHAAT